MIVKGKKGGIEKNKICSKCNIQKDLTDFNRLQDKRYERYKEYCKACTHKKFVEKGPYKNKGKNKAWKSAKAYIDRDKIKYPVSQIKTRFVEPGTKIGEI